MEAENADFIETIYSEKKFNGRTNPPGFSLKCEKAYPWTYYRDGFAKLARSTGDQF